MAGETSYRRRDHAPLRVGFIGAGNYAASMLLPHLAQRPDVQLARVATARPLSACDVQRRFNFTEATIEVGKVLDDDSIDAIFIVTPHADHAALAAAALLRGKAVFVEKPLAITCGQLEEVLRAVQASGNDRLMIGFNRRFSPMLTELRRQFGCPASPGVARYLISVGPLPAGSWYARSRTQGSRFVGEGGHFIDTLSWWFGVSPSEVRAVSLGHPDDVQVDLSFPGGSMGTITYVSSGHPRFPKETIDISGPGRSARLDNFSRATVWREGGRWVRHRRGAAGKGQCEEVQAFLDAVRHGAPMPVPMCALAVTTRATLAVPEAICSGAPVHVS